MEFDITDIDKKLLLQCLFAHSEPIGFGKVEHSVRKSWGENVDGLTLEDCEELLEEFNSSTSLSTVYDIVDYHKGKPMKVNFYRNKNNRISVDSESYDVRNGKYRFLEAMLNTFSFDEIKITKKGYRQMVFNNLPQNLIREKTQEKMFKNLIKDTIRQENSFGKLWVLDENKISYKPPFMDY